MSLIVFGLWLATWGWGYRWKQIATATPVVRPETTPTVPSYRITYKEGRARKTMVVPATTEADALSAAARNGCRFNTVLEVVKL